MESRAPDYLAPIAGARAWRLAPNLMARTYGYLWSHAATTFWPDNEEMVGKCDSWHPAPAKGCSCGVYAWKSPALMHSNGYGPADHLHISGVVAGRGRFIRGERGYWVAEGAVVLAFFRDDYPSPVREVLSGSGVYLPTKEEAARIYNVPVIEFGEFDSFCDEYGLIRF